MSQTPATPNLANPQTEADYAALKALHLAQAEALDAQAKLINSQKALAKAQAPADAAAAQLAAATQAANVASQQQALAASNAATMKTRFAVPDSGYAGEVKPGDKAGVVEASLLAARALNTAAAGIANDLKALKIDRVVLYGGADLPDFQPLLTFQVQTEGLKFMLTEAQQKLDSAYSEATEHMPGNEKALLPLAVGGVGEALEAANKLLGYFRSDYTIQGVAVTADDLLLVNAIAGSLTQQNIKVLVPALYNPAALEPKTPVVDTLNRLSGTHSDLKEKVRRAASALTSLQGMADKENDSAKKSGLTENATELKEAVDQAQLSLAAYDALISKVTTPDDKAKVPLAAIVQQSVIRAALADGAFLMTAKISSAGGSYYTRKNLWTFFGGMPFFTMGGVVVNYTVFDGKDGFVVKSGALPVDGGYFKVGSLPKVLDH